MTKTYLSTWLWTDFKRGLELPSLHGRQDCPGPLRPPPPIPMAGDFGQKLRPRPGAVLLHAGIVPGSTSGPPYGSLAAPGTPVAVAANAAAPGSAQVVLADDLVAADDVLVALLQGGTTGGAGEAGVVIDALLVPDDHVLRVQEGSTLLTLGSKLSRSREEEKFCFSFKLVDRLFFGFSFNKSTFSNQLI